MTLGVPVDLDWTPLGKPPPLRLPRWARPVSIVGAAIGVVGAYWDVAWHVDRGRETFWSPPHLLLYAGILSVTASIVLPIAIAPGAGWRAGLRDRGLRFAVLAGIATLLSAPFDEVWHRVFGLDVSIWSPPHLVLLFGSMLAILGLALLQVPADTGRGMPWAVVLLAAVALVVANVFVLEFEFRALERWHVVVARPRALYPLSVAVLAVLVLGSAARAGGRPWVASQAGAAAWILRAGIGTLVLPALGASAPRLPPVYLVPGLVLDLALGLVPATWSPRRAFLLGGMAAAGAAHLVHDPLAVVVGARTVGWEALGAWLPLALAAGAAAGLLGLRIGALVRPLPMAGR